MLQVSFHEASSIMRIEDEGAHEQHDLQHSPNTIISEREPLATVFNSAFGNELTDAIEPLPLAKLNEHCLSSNDAIAE